VFHRKNGKIESMKRAEQIEIMQRELLTWYEVHQRDLPWRRTRDPYAIWLSEIMLQQTQVATVIPYYKCFLKEFPTVKTLAQASIDRVLKLWQGLGYYSRARNLHRAAQVILSEYNGKIPQTTDELQSLPGIGRYTAGAIASIAFDLDEPVLDGNVERVLCRVFRVKTSPKETSTHKKLWALARLVVPTGRACFFNQAMMDLGATICTPRGPECERCPLREICQARRNNEQNDLPVKTKRPPTPHYEVVAGVIWKNDKILIDQRKHEGLLGGLWEFPGGKREANETFEECLVREVREELGIEISVGKELTVVQHAYSHFRITLHAFECRYRSGRPRAMECADFKWVKLADLDNYAFPKANVRILTVLRSLHR
jgi:A/G-specific adenine glycosylase